MADQPITVDSEEWRAVPSWEGYYEVSSLGRVRSLARKVPFFSYKAQRMTTFSVRERFMRPNFSMGYPVVLLSRGEHTERHLVHRLVLLAFCGPCPDGREGAHLNGDPLDARLANLMWATHRENVGHTAIHGTRPRGERQGAAKLTEGKVRAIRAAGDAGRGASALARWYGVSRSAVEAICRRKTWRHVA